MPLPLTMLRPGETSIITHVGGNPETKRFLEGLGFVVGSHVSVVSQIDGNVICSIKDARVAVGQEMAKKIFV